MLRVRIEQILKYCISLTLKRLLFANAEMGKIKSQLQIDVNDKVMRNKKKHLKNIVFEQSNFNDKKRDFII